MQPLLSLPSPTLSSYSSSFSWRNLILPTSRVSNRNSFSNNTCRIGMRNVSIFLSTRSSSQLDQENDPKDGQNSSLFGEDFSYILKAAVSSMAVACVIKYGSGLFPEITKPSLLNALIMVLSPVVISVVLLLKESSTKSKS